MNPRPSRFRPRLEALEERALLSVSVSLVPAGSGMGLTIDASQSTAHNVISIFNNGNGLIKGYVTGDPDGAGFFTFFGVGVGIVGGPGGTDVYYYQRGEQVTHSVCLVVAEFGGGKNTFAANLQGSTLMGLVDFRVFGGGGNDSISINATNVTIAGSLGGVASFVRDDHSPPGGTTNFSEDYSGVNSGQLVVWVDGGTDTQDTLRLDATFLGTPPSRSTIPGRGGSLFGVAPGDLSLFGGAGDNNLDMLLFSPGGLSLTGDVYAGSGTNSCFRTANVKDHGCQFDRVFVPLGRIVPHHVLPGF
jgi:hypothetical protein